MNDEEVMEVHHFKNGAKVEIITGTTLAVAGPHPTKVPYDEVELMDLEVWQAALDNAAKPAIVKEVEMAKKPKKPKKGY